ncbi:MAG: hypothetical protein L0Y60_15590 [Beijerinckiaceae bacterium]|nr:hypothetical protein [Beijerinckiaceae bacterium]
MAGTAGDPFDAEGINLTQALAKAQGLLDSRADHTCRKALEIVGLFLRLAASGVTAA